MQKKFEINRTKIKGGCQSGGKVVTYISKIDLSLITSLKVNLIEKIIYLLCPRRNQWATPYFGFHHQIELFSLGFWQRSHVVDCRRWSLFFHTTWPQSHCSPVPPRCRHLRIQLCMEHSDCERWPVNVDPAQSKIESKN